MSPFTTGGQSFSSYPKFSGKLTFLTPPVRTHRFVRQRKEMFVFQIISAVIRVIAGVIRVIAAVIRVIVEYRKRSG